MTPDLDALPPDESGTRAPAPGHLGWSDGDKRPSILIVDDDASAILVLSRILGGLGRLRFATSGTQALHLAQQESPDLVLLDIEMPDMSGLDVCTALKHDSAGHDIPVIFITSHHSQDDELAGLAAGAVDFIAKPPLAPLVQARVRTHLRLKRLTDILRQSATQDAVTGISNRRQLEESLPKLWLRSLRESQPLSLLMVDVDFFKEYNDTCGHLEGDRVLRTVAGAIQSSLTSDRDLLARYGGDEFALVLPDTGPTAAEAVAARITDHLADLAIPHPASRIGTVVTVSIGGSTHLPDVGDGPTTESRRALIGPDDLLLVADSALYDAKQAGRGCARFRPMAGATATPDLAIGEGAAEPHV